MRNTNKRVDKLLTVARLSTENDSFSSTEGVDNIELLQYVNDAQQRLLGQISNKHQNIFVKESPLISVNPNQEVYVLPDDILLENRVTTVEYSSTALTRDLRKLIKLDISARQVGFTGFPKSYILRSGSILLSPIPSQSGVLRINYQRSIADLDLRRGKVLSVTLDNLTNKITALTIDINQNDYDGLELANADHICIITSLGLQKMVSIELDSFDQVTGIATVSTNFTFIEGETIAIGDFVVAGFNATTHSELPKICERFLIAYMSWKLFKRDSSDDAIDASAELQSMERDILDSFSEATDDIDYIPLISMDD